MVKFNQHFNFKTMLEKPKGVTPPKEEWKPEPAESFEIEFLNAKSKEVRNAMLDIGGFIFRSSGPEGENSVYFEGERDDGSKIRIVIEKGQNYKSPKEIADEAVKEEE